MKTMIAMILVITCVVGGCSSGEEAGDQAEGAAGKTAMTAIDQAQVASARLAVKTFGGDLKMALLAGLGEGGPGDALAVCQESAPKIAALISQQTGWDVGRTSLQTRNSDNAPDAWERQVLQSFATAQAEGKDPSDLEHYEVVTENSQQYLRYMKAIPTGRLCLQCHGRNVAAPTLDQIRELYPQDRATGFAEGDIRGAFTLRKPV